MSMNEHKSKMILWSSSLYFVNAFLITPNKVLRFTKTYCVNLIRINRKLVVINHRFMKTIQNEIKLRLSISYQIESHD